MHQHTPQALFVGSEGPEVFASDVSTFHYHRQTPQWPITAATPLSAGFGLTAANPWAINSGEISPDSHDMSASPTSFDHAFVSSPESIVNRFSGDFSSDQSQEDVLQAASWKSVNSDECSFSPSITDFGADEIDGYQSPELQKKTGKSQRRRRKNTDPKQRHAEKLEKNRKAAERCRQKQRAFVSNLQERAREEELKRARLIAQVNQLRDSILSLKESMVSHSGCNDERIKQYLLSELSRATQRHNSSSSISSTPLSPSAPHELLRRQSG